MKKIGLGLVCTAVVLSAGAEGIYKNGWIDRNKNGEMAPYENPALSVDERVGTSSAPAGIKINGEFNLR